MKTRFRPRIYLLVCYIVLAHTGKKIQYFAEYKKEHKELGTQKKIFQFVQEECVFVFEERHEFMHETLAAKWK